MTLRTRLAGMMVLVLVAVVAVQFVLAERERRSFAARLESVSGDLDRSTAVFVQRAHEFAGRRPPEMDALLAEMLPDSARARIPANATVQILIASDSLHARSRSGPGLQTWEKEITRRGPVEGAKTKNAQRIVWMRSGHTMKDSVHVDVDSVVIGARLSTTRSFQRHAGPLPRSPGRDFIINLPLPSIDSDSTYAVQVRYSYASLAEELARSRRRSLAWLAGLLGLGTLAAIGVAGQFTRPIRALESSFGRVVKGDLDVSVRPERRDEIGHLTQSFNEMVARLRESQRMAERLSESEHLASLGRLAAGIAHEIRNPLNAILLNLQQMHDRVRAGMDGGETRHTREEFDKYHARMTAEIGRLERMVGSFLDLAKSGELRFERMDVAAGLRGAAELFRPVATERDVQLVTDLPATLEIEADASRLPAVWNNLLANAIEATPPGGRVALRARGQGGEIEVDVEDTGPGIPPDLHARIWEPFYSGRDSGTGLGLAIVRSCVEHHGGRVEVEMPAGGGTRMRVHLPVQRPASASTSVGEDA